MIAGMYSKPGSVTPVSQLWILVLSTPICSATCFWSIFRTKRLLRRWSPTVRNSVGNADRGDGAVRLRQNQRYRLVVWAEAVSDGDVALLNTPAFDRFHSPPSYQDFDEAPFQIPADRLLEPFPKFLQESLGGVDRRTNRVGSGDLTAQFGDLR